MFTSSRAPHFKPSLCVQEGRTSAAVGLLGVSSTDPSGEAAIHRAKLGGWRVDPASAEAQSFSSLMSRILGLGFGNSMKFSQGVSAERNILCQREEQFWVACFWGGHWDNTMVTMVYHDTRVTKIRIWVSGCFWGWTVTHTSVSCKGMYFSCYYCYLWSTVTQDAICGGFTIMLLLLIFLIFLLCFKHHYLQNSVFSPCIIHSFCMR